MSIIRCKDCNNSDRFYEVRRVAYTEVVLVDGEGDFREEIDSGEDTIEVLGYECADCDSTNIEWSED